jgi:beta-glucosidase
MYYNHKPSAQYHDYLSQDILPLFHFGFGLSYTRFTYAKPRIEKSSITVNGSTRVLVDITNEGNRPGDEIVQLYIRDKISSVTRPVKELRGFQRVSLNPGETKTAMLDITPELLAFHNIDMQFLVEPGEFDIMTGSSSRDEDLQLITLTVI